VRGDDTVTKRHEAMIWTDSDKLGLRVTVVAESLTEAREQLEMEHGERTAFDLHSEDDAERPR
jgi:hypothetical protein